MAYKKYQRLVLEGSNDGVNWVVQEPKMYKRGDVIEEDSKDCGGGGGGDVTKYRWTEVVGEYICINNNKYKLLKKEFYDADNRVWITVYPLETMEGDLIEENSSDCEYGVNWVDTTRFACVEEGDTPIPPKPLCSVFYSYYDGTSSYITPKSRILGRFDDFDNTKVSIIRDDDCGAYSFIEANAFELCSYLQEATLISVTGIGPSAFKSCYSLQTVNMPMLSYTANSTFAFCSALETIELQSVENITTGCFAYCEKLNNISFPNAAYIGIGAFAECVALSKVSLSKAIIIESNAFADCISLNEISIPLVRTICDDCFEGCVALETVRIDRVSSVTRLSGTQNFFGCENLKSIYVPTSLVDAFKADSKWMSLADKIVGA